MRPSANPESGIIGLRASEKPPLVDVAANFAKFIG
jgi:hypothetical protein